MSGRPETNVAPNKGNECPAITEWPDDIEWERAGAFLPRGLSPRLAAANRALFAANQIAQMLVRDERGKDRARANEDVTYCGLLPVEVEALGLAMIELGQIAEYALVEIRENDCGWGKRQAEVQS